MKVMCYHLVDGSIVMGQAGNGGEHSIEVVDPMLLTKHKAGLEYDVYAVLTKYDSFSKVKDKKDSTSVEFFYTGIMSAYEVDESIKEFYSKFVAAGKESPPTVTTKSAKDVGVATNVSEKKVDINELRKDTIRMVVDNDKKE